MMMVSSVQYVPTCFSWEHNSLRLIRAENAGLAASELSSPDLAIHYLLRLYLLGMTWVCKSSSFLGQTL